MRTVRFASTLSIAFGALMGCAGPETTDQPVYQPQTPTPMAETQAVDEGRDLEADLPPRTEEQPGARTQLAREIYLSGVASMNRNDYDAAEREFKQALTVDPEFYRAHFKLGLCYFYQGRYGYEVTQYRKCLVINPHFVPAWQNLGNAYLTQDALELARDAYEHVLELEPNHAQAIYNKALVEYDLGSRQEAARLFRRFLELTPEKDREMRRVAVDYLKELDGGAQ
ncbi:MAG: tetratricopeptide repeat protein [Planctomycetota bacterium]